MTNYEEIYNSIINQLKQKNSTDIINVAKAYEFAKEKHKDQFRKSGEPYILHPVEVAKILCDTDFNTDVISAAILHDTVEDCGVSIDELKTMFNSNIAQIVDSVTAIKKENFIINQDDIYTNTNDFLKLAIDDQTFQKLITIGKQNKFGFYIKFADRLNNLGTISCFPRYKKEAKVTETKKWVIPLAKILKTKYFYDNLQNKCFLVWNEENSQKFLKYYEICLKNMQNYLKELKNLISYRISNLLSNSKTKLSLSKIIIEPKTQYEVFYAISKRFEISKIDNIKESNFIFVPLYNIYIIVNENIQSNNNISLLYQIIEENFSDKFKIINFSQDKLGNNFLGIKDDIRNLFDVSLLSRHEYTTIQNGTTDGTDIDLIDETSSSGVDTKFITVYSPSKEKIKIQEHSTVLDFAFKLHKDIGFSCKYAYINGSPNKSPIYTKLNDGDQIEIVCELEKGLNVNIAELRWLAYCKNEYTQKVLIKYFERKYNDK